MKKNDERTIYIQYRTLCPIPEASLEQVQTDTLDLSSQNLEDISFLKNYKNLKVLNLRRNKIKDIHVLAELEHLEELDLSYNQIQDFSPLKSLKHLRKIAPQKLNGYLGVAQSGTEVPLQLKNNDWYKKIRNPRIEKSGIIFKKTSVTWDCITFGNYPQEQVSYMKKQVKEKLQEMENGDLVYKGEGDLEQIEKFRKASRWYYKYQPICWRVLRIQKGKALLFSDKILDATHFSYSVRKGVPATWENSWIYDWLNSKEEPFFYNMAFSKAEKEVIIQREEGAVSLLPYSAIHEMSFASYGFFDLYAKGKLAIDSPKAKVFSDYAQVKGLKVSKRTISGGIEVGSGPWWMGTFTRVKDVVYAVEASGKLDSYGIHARTDGIGVRPMIEVDLTKLDENDVQISTITV